MNINCLTYRGKGVFLIFGEHGVNLVNMKCLYMESQYKKYKDKGVEIIAINVGETQLAIETLRISIIYLFL